MTKTRRKFLKTAAVLGATFSLASVKNHAVAEDIKDALWNLKKMSPQQAAEDEDLWARIRQAYTTSSTLINLNNGGVSPQPKVVQDAVDRYYHLSNEAPSYYMWRILDAGREPLREKLALFAGCSSEEIVVNRNTTEALDTVIFGLNLKKDDEIVVCEFDYPNMKAAWLQREMRDGIKLKWISLNLPIEDEEAIVQKYVAAFTKKTKVVHITHLINWTGQIVPAKRICEEAKKRGIKTIVDGAHSFAHLTYKISDLGCDYFGTSLHKWLCAPFGTGMLYVKKENIKALWPLIPDHDPTRDDIRKFENLGTRSFAPEQAIAQAIDFHNAIGSERKEARLHYLRNYWMEKCKNIPGIKYYTSNNNKHAGALAVVGIDGIDAGAIHNHLQTHYKIHVTPIEYLHINGVRITPHVYTLKPDLDKLIKALSDIASGMYN